MFCARYFCNRAFAPRYFPKVGADPPLSDFLTTGSLLLMGVGN